MSPPPPIAMSGILRYIPTLVLGGLGGFVAYHLNMPLPWLLGALITTTAVSLAGIRLGSPGRVRKAVLVVIGVMLGSAFAPGMASDFAAWSGSLIIMLIATASMMVVAVWFSHRIAGHSLDTAIYAGAPGGLSSLLPMAQEAGADLRAVGMTHAVRILVLLVSIPPLLNLIGHVDISASRSNTSQWLSFPGLEDSGWLAGAAVVGVVVGRLLRLPNSLLFGPALASSVLHLSGTTHAVLPPALIALAQVIIGTSVGVRFVGVTLREMARQLGLALIQAVMLTVLAVVAAWVGHELTGYSVAAALIAYMPGGAPELSLVALALNIEPAFVTSHHLLRITVLLITLPLLIGWLTRKVAR